MNEQSLAGGNLILRAKAQTSGEPKQGKGYTINRFTDGKTFWKW